MPLSELLANRSAKLTASGYRRLSWGTFELLMLLERNRKCTNVFLLVDRAAAVDRGAMKTGSSDLASS
jgi:hypothetical protein